MNWTPNKWLAIVASLTLWPVGLLYLGRWWLPVLYLAAFLLTGIVEFAAGTPMYSPLVVLLASPVHAYWQAARSQPRVRPWYSRWYGIVGISAVVFAFIGAGRAFLIEPFRVPTAAMEPTVPRGSFLLVSKLGYRHHGTFGITLSRGAPARSPRRGAIVVFEAPHVPGKHFFKRVLGLPGDVIVFKGKTASVNGDPLTRLATGNVVTEELDGMVFETLLKDDRPPRDLEFTVPPGHYFLVGDNRDGSDDSRRFGAVPAELLIGEVVCILPRGVQP